MGWAKYDEDIREIIEERRTYCSVNYGYNYTTQYYTRPVSSYSSLSNRITNKSGCYIKHSNDTVKY